MASISRAASAAAHLAAAMDDDVCMDKDVVLSDDGYARDDASTTSSVATAASPVSVQSAGHSPRFMSKRKQHSKVIIFDWDDTLMASSWLARNGMGLDKPAVVPEHIASPLRVLARGVYKLLTAAMTHGRVVIITNAETGWVELSAQKFMPKVAPLLERVTVVSARSTYQTLFPNSPSDWKVAAFTHELYSTFDVLMVGDEVDVPSLTSPSAKTVSVPNAHVISFGDSVYERTAVHAASSRIAARSKARVLTKSVKFVERPTLDQVTRQVDLVISCLHDICHHDAGLDLMLTIQLLEQQQKTATA